MINHYDVSAEYSFQLGAALAREYDKKVAKTIALAARTSAALLPGHVGGSVLASGATVATDATLLTTAFWLAAQKFDEKKVDQNDRYIALAPAQYYLMVRNGTAFISRDFLPEAGSNGTFKDGVLKTAAGLTICKTINLPAGNGAANVTDALENNNYTADFTNLIALAWQKQVSGTLKRQDINLKVTEDNRRLGHLMVAKMAIGHGVLRPECAVEIQNL